jgi:hypothetical protein
MPRRDHGHDLMQKITSSNHQNRNDSNPVPVRVAVGTLNTFWLDSGTSQTRKAAMPQPFDRQIDQKQPRVRNACRDQE